VATVSGRATGLLQGVGNLLPAGYALGAGMAAAVNPCGFALLPAYIGLYLGTESATAPRLARAVAVGAAMTTGCVALFGLARLVLAAVAEQREPRAEPGRDRAPLRRRPAGRLAHEGEGAGREER
jgi:hypothetical protein